MSRGGKTLGVVATATMFAFSTWMYLRTGDWVAVLFALGSVAYGIYFFSQEVSS